MTSTQVAREPLLQRAKRKVERLAGPAGIFFKGFLKHPAMVGAIVPSSNRTIERVLSVVDWEECRLFVEYGPGVGTFCRPVLEKLRRDGRLIVIDTNPDFIAYLQKTIGDSRFIAVHGSGGRTCGAFLAQADTAMPAAISMVRVRRLFIVFSLIL